MLNDLLICLVGCCHVKWVVALSELLCSVGCSYVYWVVVMFSGLLYLVICCCV